MGILKLAQLVMRVPNKAHVHAPSLNLAPIEMDADEFMANHADRGKAMKVSLAHDGVSEPQNITAYVVDVPLHGATIPSEVIVDNGRGWLNELKD